LKRYRGIKLFDEDQQDLDLYMQEILEKRKLEATVAAEAPEEEDFTPEENEGDGEEEGNL
jgi:DNA-directed RNA polymerase subunit beta'